MKHQVIILILFIHIHFSVQEFTPIRSLKDVIGKSSKHEQKALNVTACKEQLDFFLEALKTNQVWALKFYDTWGKVQSGLFSFNVLNFGEYDQCVNFEMATQNVGTIEGKHCFVQFLPTENATEYDNDDNNRTIKSYDWAEIATITRLITGDLINSICMPAVCSEAQVVDFLSNDFQFLKEFNVRGASCKEKEDLSVLEPVDIALISIFSISIILMIISTIYDIIEQRKETPNPNKLLIAFSVYTNGKKLLDMSESKSSINSLHGLRAISMFWIMFGHRITNQINFPVENHKDVYAFDEQLYSVIVYSYSIAVDTFFLMGALLLTISTLRAIDKDNLNIFRMILHRYLRYTPVIGVCILCLISLPRFVVNGPLDIGDFRDDCIKYWWSALLHIQNYVNPHNLCLTHGWYISVDFQLFILSPFLIYVIKKNRMFKWLIPALIVACSIYIFTMSMVFKLYKTARYPDEFEINRRWIYQATHARIQSWLIGIALGFYLYEKKNEKAKMSSLLDAFLWIVSLSMILAIILLAYIFQIPYISQSSSLVSNALFMSLHRVGWALAIAYIIFACENLKSGSIIRWFLSHSYWKPIGTMGLSLYITHLIYMIFHMTNARQNFHFSIWTMMHTVWGDFIPSILIASFFYLAFETPYLLIENYIYKKLTKSE